MTQTEKLALAERATLYLLRQIRDDDALREHLHSQSEGFRLLVAAQAAFDGLPEQVVAERYISERGQPLRAIQPPEPDLLDRAIRWLLT